jgi:Protein of unknown function (DUF3102)
MARRRTSGALAAEIREELDAMVNAFSVSASHAIRVGHLLLEAKTRVEHGQWETWVREVADRVHAPRASRALVDLPKRIGRA